MRMQRGEGSLSLLLLLRLEIGEEEIGVGLLGLCTTWLWVLAA